MRKREEKLSTKGTGGSPRGNPLFPKAMTILIFICIFLSILGIIWAGFVVPVEYTITEKDTKDIYLDDRNDKVTHIDDLGHRNKKAIEPLLNESISENKVPFWAVSTSLRGTEKIIYENEGKEVVMVIDVDAPIHYSPLLLIVFTLALFLFVLLHFMIKDELKYDTY